MMISFTNTQVKGETSFKVLVPHKLALLRAYMFEDALSRGLKAFKCPSKMN